MQETREGQLAINTLIISLGTFLPRLVSFITLPILTGILTQEEYGTYDLITILTSLLLPSVTLQINTAAFRFLIDARDDQTRKESIISNIIVVIITTSTITLVIFYICISSLGDRQIRLLICIYLFVDIINLSLRQIARGLSQNMHYSVSAIVGSIGRCVIVVFTVWIYRWGLNGAILALILADTVSAIYLMFSIHITRFLNVKLVKWTTIKELVSYSWPMVPNEMSLWVMRVSDRLVVTAILGVAANAVYSVANKIPSIINMGQSAFTLAWQENASVTVHDEDAPEYYTKMFDVMLRLQSGIFGLVLCATPILFVILIRGDYDDAYVQIPILCLAIFYSSMATFLGGIYVAYKKTRSIGITTIASAILNLVIDFALIRFIGLYAASLSTLVSYICLFIYRANDVQKFVKVKIDYSELIKINCIFILELILFYFNLFATNVINIIFCMIVFVILNKEFVLGIWKRLKKMIKKN